MSEVAYPGFLPDQAVLEAELIEKTNDGNIRQKQVVIKTFEPPAAHVKCGGQASEEWRPFNDLYGMSGLCQFIARSEAAHAAADNAYPHSVDPSWP